VFAAAGAFFEELADDGGAAFEFSGLPAVGRGEVAPFAFVGDVCHASADFGGFFQDADGGPEGLLKVAGDFGDEAVAGVHVSDVASETELIARSRFPKRPSAFRAGECGRGTEHFGLFEGGIADLGDVGEIATGAHGELLWQAFLGIANEEIGDLIEAGDVINGDVADAGGGHGGEFGFFGVLSDGDAAALLDDAHAVGAIVETAGEDDADDAGAEVTGGGAEEGIDGGAEAVFLWTVGDADAAIFEEEVEVGGSDVDAAGGGFATIGGELGGEGTGDIKEAGEDAGGTRGGVDDDEEGGGQMGREARDDLLNDGNTASGGPDHDDVTNGHKSPLSVEAPGMGCFRQQRQGLIPDYGAIRAAVPWKSA
jgi:hypothetical protein